MPKCFDCLGEERSELNWTKLHEKGFSEGKKIPAVKFKAATKIVPKISCVEISGNEISSGEIGRGENIMHQNLTR